MDLRERKPGAASIKRRRSKKENRNTVKQKTVCCDLLHFITFFDFFQAFLFYFDGMACMNEKQKEDICF